MGDCIFTGASVFPFACIQLELKQSDHRSEFRVHSGLYTQPVSWMERMSVTEASVLRIEVLKGSFASRAEQVSAGHNINSDDQSHSDA